MSTTTINRKPRPKYKALYFAAQREAVAQGYRANQLTTKMQRIQRAIAPEAEHILNIHRHDTPFIVLAAHDYVCVEAMFELNSRVGSDLGLPGFGGMSYRETPIVERGA